MEKPDGSGPVTPIHVKVKTHGDDAGLACAEDGCKEISTPAGRGQQNFFCHHISQALHCPSNVDESEYPDIQSVTMSTAMKASVIKLKTEADQTNTPLVVKWPHSTFSDFFSVYTGTARYWCQFGRTVVMASDVLRCPCSGIKYNCVHKAIVRWILQVQHNENDNTDNKTSPSETSQSLSTISLSDSIKYSLGKKKNPNLVVDFDLSVEFSPIIPNETQCPWCYNILTSKSATDNGIVIDQHFTRKGLLMIYN